MNRLKQLRKEKKLKQEDIGILLGAKNPMCLNTKQEECLLEKEKLQF